MGARTTAREAALQMLFAIDATSNDTDQAISDFWRELPGDAEGRGGSPLFEGDEVGAVAHVDARRGEIGRNEALPALAVEEDQVAQLRQGARMALRQIVPAAAWLPAFPVAVVFGQIVGDFALQDIDGLEGARRVFAEHDAEMFDPALAEFQLAFARKHQVADEYRDYGKRADQRDDQRQEIRTAANHPGKG